MGDKDTVSEFEEFLNWRKGQASAAKQEGLLGEIRDSLKALGDRLGGAAAAGDNEGDTGDGTPPPPPARPGPADTGTTGERGSRWFGDKTG